MSQLKQAIETVYANIDGDSSYVTELTQQMVGFKSINPAFMPDPENSEEAACQAFMAAELQKIGLDVKTVEAVEKRPNLVACKQGAGGG